MKLLIAGVPGSGKTRLGDYLKDNHQYFHIDLETPEGIQQFYSRGNMPNTVVTWGYPPIPEAYQTISACLTAGFVLVWLQSSDFSSNEIYTKRETQLIQKGLRPSQHLGNAIELLSIQLASIKQDEPNRKKYPFIEIDPFFSYCTFKDSSLLINEISALSGQNI
jgi:hypothetical protein